VVHGIVQLTADQVHSLVNSVANSNWQVGSIFWLALLELIRRCRQYLHGAE